MPMLFFLLEDRPPEWCAYILNLQGKRNVGIEITQSITRYSETFSCHERNYEQFVNAFVTGGTGGFGQKQWQSPLTMLLGVMSTTTAGAKWKSENSGLNKIQTHDLCGTGPIVLSRQLGALLFYEFVITNQTSVTEIIAQKTITLYLDLLMIFFDVEGNVLHLVTQYLQRRFLAKNKIQYGLFVTSQGSHKSNSWKHAHNTKHGYMQPVRMARNKSNIRNEQETINLQQCWFLLWNNWGLWPKRLKWYLDLLKNP